MVDINRLSSTGYGCFRRQSQVKVMALRFSIWKPALGNGGPSRVRIYGLYSNLVDRIRSGQLLSNIASHVIPSALLN